jgi:hypothetical protein
MLRLLSAAASRQDQDTEADSTGTNVIETSRIMLRELSAVQVARVLELLAEGGTSRECVPGYPLAGSGFAARHFTERRPGELRFGFGMYLLVRRCDGLAIGDIGFHRPPLDGTVEIGFGLAEPARAMATPLRPRPRWPGGHSRSQASAVSSRGPPPATSARRGS